jgi:hypothetical protein
VRLPTPAKPECQPRPRQPCGPTRHLSATTEPRRRLLSAMRPRCFEHVTDPMPSGFTASDFGQIARIDSSRWKPTVLRQIGCREIRC